MENSFEGTVAVSLDGLVHDVNLYLTGEVILPIRQMLLARPNIRLGDISVIRSHPQALAQCRQTLARLLPGVPLEAAASTANAARAVASDTVPAAAIAPRVAAELYGLQILVADIHDSATNATRFGVVRRRPVPPTGDDKTTIVFSFAADRPGSLYKALGEFARRGINLVKLESRPARLALGNYLFFADLEGHCEDAAVADALAALKRQCSMLRVLGSYPRARYDL